MDNSLRKDTYLRKIFSGFYSSLIGLTVILSGILLVSQIVTYLIPLSLLGTACLMVISLVLVKQQKYKAAHIFSCLIFFVGLSVTTLMASPSVFHPLLFTVVIWISGITGDTKITIVFYFLVLARVIITQIIGPPLNFLAMMYSLSFYTFSLLFIVFFLRIRQHQEKNRLIQSSKTLDATLFILGFTAELRDKGTSQHLERVSEYVSVLANELHKNPNFKAYLNTDYIRDLAKVAPLHDVGKVGISDSILLKTSGLTKEEYEILKTHTEIGGEILDRAQQKLHYETVFNLAIQIAKFHHERWDGKGYPLGLVEENIPLSARIMAIADVYDALRSERPYKPAYPHTKCVEIILQGRGTQFDPALVDCFLNVQEDFRKVSESKIDSINIDV